ncbi:MAG: hypothetical protein H6Q90_5484 [Deltaproteobacteria bacterium]|nr:hypothetical protein [Deltaproteobacteria bacterium]
MRALGAIAVSSDPEQHGLTATMARGALIELAREPEVIEIEPWRPIQPSHGG